MTNRIREFREARGWTMRDLAARVNSTSSTINKLEKGQITLDVNWLAKLSSVLHVPMMALIDQSVEAAILTSDVEPFDGNAKEAFPGLALGGHHSIYIAKSNALDEIGIFPGHFLFVSDLPATFEKVPSGSIVIAEIPGKNDGSNNIRLLRHFIYPNLLITNSTAVEIQSIINIRSTPMIFKGTVLYNFSSHR